MAVDPPDVLLAVEFVDRFDLHTWSRIGYDLLQSTPRIHHDDAEHLDDVLGWAAARIGKPHSHVEAAVANAARALEDVILVLHYEMDVRDNHYWVTQWNRRSYGQKVRPRRVEEFGVHVALIHNLVIELNRACNLVIDRARLAAPDLLPGVGSAVVATGREHAPMQAMRYSDDEAKDPQPYPGLAAFPAAAKENRQVGLLGNATYDEPHTLTAFADWIAHIGHKRGPHSDPPPSDEMPFALPQPSRHLRANSWPPAKSPPSPWRAFAGILTAGSVIAGLLASFPWLVGATVGSAALAGLLHRRVWRIPPQTVPTVAVIAAAIAGGVLAEIIAGNPTRVTRSGGPSLPGPPRSRKSAGALRLQTSMLAYNSSDGQRWGGTISGDAGDALRFRLRVANTASTPTPPLELGLARSDLGGDTAVAFVSAFHERGSDVSPLLGARATVRAYSAFGAFLPGKTNLIDKRGRVVRELQPPITGAGLALPGALSQVGHFDVGVLRPHEEVTIAFGGSFARPSSGQLSGGQSIEFRSLPSGRYASTGAARRGDRLKFSILLANTGFEPIRVHVRLTITPHHPARYVKIAALGAGEGDRPSSLGRAIVNARGRRSIAIALEPGTTEIWRAGDANPKCPRPAFLGRFTDGLDEGGLDIERLGGYKSHDPCHGAEFTRFLNFIAVVR